MGDFIFEMPSFIEDMGRSIDLGATMEIYNESITPSEADLIALRNDWAIVGQEMRDAMGAEPIPE